MVKAVKAVKAVKEKARADRLQAGLLYALQLLQANEVSMARIDAALG